MSENSELENWAEKRYGDTSITDMALQTGAIKGALHLLEAAEQFVHTHKYLRPKVNETFGKDTRTEGQKCHDAGMTNLLFYLRKYCKGES